MSANVRHDPAAPRTQAQAQVQGAATSAGAPRSDRMFRQRRPPLQRCPFPSSEQDAAWVG